MKTLLIDIKKNVLFWKITISARIFLIPLEGLMVIEINDQKLETSIRERVNLPSEHIRARGVSEETSLIDHIKERLQGHKFNGATIAEMIVFSH